MATHRLVISPILQPRRPSWDLRSQCDRSEIAQHPQHLTVVNAWLHNIPIFIASKIQTLSLESFKATRNFQSRLFLVSIVVDPEGACAILPILRKHSSCNERRFLYHKNTSLVDSINQASDQMWDALQDIPPRSLPLFLEEIRQYREILFSLRQVVDLNSSPLGHVISPEEWTSSFKNFRKIEEIFPNAQGPIIIGGRPEFFQNSSNIAVYGGTFALVQGT
ncbi:hypothetical protein CPB84DRAFT_1884215 [Gymnopilus junonius]|uniref:Uncharacterized protein n=1 Tax=Gymnopilus junonius TaxID=109634 RepID=A0A9P5TR09_GYMJU|nr:hypothetical protein CPB84DRAFT_1884215 [Gymnopilus junonius]